MKNIPIILGAAILGAHFLLGRKKSKKSKTPTPSEVDVTKFNEKFDVTFLPEGYEIPKEVSDTELWISDDCAAWAIGKNWNPTIEINGELISPEDFHKSSISPFPVYPEEIWPEETSARIWTKDLLEFWSGFHCWDKVPNIENYSSYKEYELALNSFYESDTSISNLYKFVLKLIRDRMLASWELSHEDEAYVENYKIFIKNAINSNPNASDDFIVKYVLTDALGEDVFEVDFDAPENEAYKNEYILVDGILKSVKQYHA